jgi:prefoldin subunit 5
MNELKARYDEMLAEKAARDEARKFQEEIEALYRQQENLWNKINTFDMAINQLYEKAYNSGKEPTEEQMKKLEEAVAAVEKKKNPVMMNIQKLDEKIEALYKQREAKQQQIEAQRAKAEQEA